MSELQLDGNLVSDTPAKPKRPPFLKTICILSFISCAWWLSLFGALTPLLNLDSTEEGQVRQMWDQVMQKEKNAELFSGIDPIQFFQAIGLFSVYSALLTLVTFIGVMMMWRLNRIGFFIYVAAEIISKLIFYTVDLGIVKGSGASGAIIFFIALDLVFIGMYAANLKYMRTGNQLPE